MRNADTRKYVTACALLLGAASLFAGSGCASKTGSADSISAGQTTSAPSSAQMGASAPVDASLASGTSSPSSPTQSASGLVYDQPYVWTQDEESDGEFYKYVFHHDGICECYRGERNAQKEANGNGNDSIWTLLIGDAPFQIRSSSSGSSIRVDWSKCQPDTPCAQAGANSDDGIYDIQSAGFRLLDTSDQTYFILQRS